MSRSSRSLTVQPAPLKSKAPTPNNDNILKSGRFPDGAAKAMDLQGFAQSCKQQTNRPKNLIEHS